ncbi:tetratricopeptide repeat protein [Ruegeria hyattellae]|uniref:tetratricopeptide repeat protein n=1 Tax=Ruegeria hyattellae TaxID=3233337 RepID=UPI00355AE73A
MTSKTLKEQPKPDPVREMLTDEDIRQALAAILGSPEFEGAERLQSFLCYIVETLLAGHSDDIRAKSIAEDVYGRSLGERGDPMAVVRVDAGRMRRRLADYYSNSGKDEVLRIHVDPGGYIPRFEILETEQTKRRSKLVSKAWLRGAATVCSLVIIVMAVWVAFLKQEPRAASGMSQNDRKQQAIREALFSTNPTKLQAVNLATEARPLMFPVLDRERLLAVRGMFNRAIALDDSYFGGHAGAAQVLGILAITSPPGDDKQQLLEKARARANRAIEISPDEGWSHSALALVSFADRDFDNAIAQSTRAMALAPDDIHVMYFDALFALFCGEFERAIASANKAQASDTSKSRFPYRSVQASASYHMGYFQNSVDRFNEAVRRGDPVSAISIGYLAASYQRLGERDRAEATILLLNEAWPDYPLHSLFRTLFADQRNAEQILSALNELAVSPASQ